MVFTFLDLGFCLNFHRNKKKVSVGSNNCAEIQSLVDALSAWKIKTDNYICRGTVSENKRNFKCSIDIEDCLPENIRNYFAKKATEAGPNCFNTGLVFSGLLPNLRYSTSEEIGFYMNSELCKKRGPEEKPSPGDLGLISMVGINQDRPMVYSGQHAFIYLSEDFVYEKMDSRRTSPFTIARKAETLKSYGLNPDESADENKIYNKINREVSYYQCVSVSQYLTETPNVPEELMSLWNKMLVEESCIEKFTMDRTPLRASSIKNIIDVSKALTSYLQEIKKEPGKYDEEKSKFMIGSLQMKLKSISSALLGFVSEKKADPNLSIFAADLYKSIYGKSK